MYSFSLSLSLALSSLLHNFELRPVLIYKPMNRTDTGVRPTAAAMEEIKNIHGPRHAIDSHAARISYRKLSLDGSCVHNVLEQGNGPLLRRVESLDHVLSTLEGVKVPTESAMSKKAITSCRRHSSARFTPSNWEEHCKPAEFLLEEVEEKGSLVERVSKLEKRVLWLQQILPAKFSSDVSSAALTIPPPHEQDIDVEKHIDMVPPSRRRQPELLSSTGHSDTSLRIKGHTQHAVDNKGLRLKFESSASDDGMLKSEDRNVRFKNWLAKRLHIQRRFPRV